MVDLLEGDLVVDHEEAPEVIVVDAVGVDPHSKPSLCDGIHLKLIFIELGRL